MDDSRLNRILGAATDLFSTRGFGGTTVQEVADLANVSAGTVINYFKTKENLLFILTRHILELFYKQLFEISRKHHDPSAALDEMLRAFTSFDLLDKAQLKIIFKTDVFLCLDRTTPPFQDINMSIIKCKSLIEDLVTKCLKKNTVNNNIARDMALLYGSLFVGLGRIMAIEEIDIVPGESFYNILNKCICSIYFEE